MSWLMIVVVSMPDTRPSMTLTAALLFVDRDHGRVGTDPDPPEDC
jgi:hypothetical protein